MMIGLDDHDREQEREFEDVVQTVWRAALDDCNGGTCAIAPILETCVRQTVDELWTRTNVKTFVPLLAIRGVKECIANGSCEPRPAVT
jgi:hypothetical protein